LFSAHQLAVGIHCTPMHSTAPDICPVEYTISRDAQPAGREPDRERVLTGLRLNFKSTRNFSWM